MALKFIAYAVFNVMALKFIAYPVFNVMNRTIKSRKRLAILSLLHVSTCARPSSGKYMQSLLFANYFTFCAFLTLLIGNIV